jgi:putative zinc finger/helix-turn-helix YgiT family protein
MNQDTAGLNSSNEVCLECGSSRLTETVEEQSFPYGPKGKQEMLVAQVPVFTCLDCGYQFFDERGEAARHEAVCRHEGVCSPEEIREIRESAGLTRAQICELAGFGPASLQRWETGAVVPNASSDRLIYLLQFSENRDRLREKNPESADQPVGLAASQIGGESEEGPSLAAQGAHRRRTKATYDLQFPTLERQGSLARCSQFAGYIQKRQCLFAPTV